MYHHYIHKEAPHLDKLWVVATVFNPQRYRSRYAHFWRFKQALDRVGAHLFVVECALGDRPFEVTEAGNPNHLQLRAWDELWIKECLINLGVQRLPMDWEYVAWIDADIQFMRDDWPEEICHQLQHYQLVQCWQSAVGLGPNGEAISTHESFGASFVLGRPMPFGKKHQPKYPIWHPGYGWAYRREAWDSLGGMIDFAILGAGDQHMAVSLIGKADCMVAHGMHPDYMAGVYQWQDRATRHIRQDFGFVPGTIFHHWHGSSRNRRYHDRWKILVDLQFDPRVDLKKNASGLWQFSDQGERFRNPIRAYFRERNEDSVDL